MTPLLWTRARDAARSAALDVWHAIAPLYESGSHIEEGPEGPSTEADKLADRLLQERLRWDFPTDTFGYLTEETEDDASRLEREHVWIIDPIDGTKDFIKKNGQFAIHIGLVERDKAAGIWLPVAAVVYRPATGELFSAVRGEGSMLELNAGAGRPVRVSGRADLTAMRGVISNSHRSGQLARLMEDLRLEDVVHAGSVGVKVGMIALGDRDVYVNLARGRCKEWDICAPDLILSEAGGAFTGLDGSRFIYNQRDVRDHHGLLGTNGVIHAEVVTRIADFEARDAR